jgi:hypothetical protein
MWRGYEACLALYHNVIIREWIRRGYKNNMALMDVPQNVTIPPWMALETFHSSHRAALLFKDGTHYGRFGWLEQPIIEYWWPTKNGF